MIKEELQLFGDLADAAHGPRQKANQCSENNS